MLTAGGITRAEYRAALGHPVRDVDDVYYIPTGATVVPADAPALVTPTANEVDTTIQGQQDQNQPTDSRQPAKPIDAPKPEPKEPPKAAEQPTPKPKEEPKPKPACLVPVCTAN